MDISTKQKTKHTTNCNRRRKLLCITSSTPVSILHSVLNSVLTPTCLILDFNNTIHHVEPQIPSIHSVRVTTLHVNMNRGVILYNKAYVFVMKIMCHTNGQTCLSQSVTKISHHDVTDREI
mmetsp:Transcript_3591/g.6293  ORF Transcript_3591/g.6293 Transcript_3591/m.6293 type:complete len:121 (-) Transcript_3591:1030-1392(-)